MSSPEQMNISFTQQGIDYQLNLVQGRRSDHTVEINGITYTVLGEKEKLETACKILASISLEAITSENDLQGRLSLRGDISFPQTQKIDDIGAKTLGINSTISVSEISVPEKTNSQDIARVNKYVDALKKSDFYSGVVLVAVGGKIVRQEAIRPEKLEQRPFTSETPFNILSVGKLFTTVAIMQLVENKDIDLDQPINQLLKLDDYTLKGCDEAYERGKLNKSDLESFMSDKNITIRHLLTHTAGLVEGSNAPTLTSYDPSKIGKEYIYSNLGFQLLARIIANKTGMPFVDYVREHIMEASGIKEGDSIRYIEHPPAQKEQPNQFSNNRPSGKVEEVEKGEHRIPSPDGNGCFWMTAADLLKFASAFTDDKLLQDPLSKEVLLKKDAHFANRALGFQVDGDGSKENPRMMIHPGSEVGASSGLCIIEGEEPITLICLSNFSGGTMALPEMWNAVLREDFDQPFQANEKLRTQYQTLLSLGSDDLEKIKKITDEIEPGSLVGVLIELEENERPDLISAIVASLTISNIAEVAVGLSTEGNQVSLKLVQQAQQSMIKNAYETLNKNLEDYASKNLKEGALLVQVVGLKEGEKSIVFGKRSVKDVVPVRVDESTIGRTGSGAKLWAGLLTNVLTSKYGQYIQMEDGLGKFAPQEALRKFGRIGSDGRDVIDTQRAKEMSVEGLVGMMAGLEYELPQPKNPPETTLDQFLRGSEIKDGSIHILHSYRP